MTDFIIGIIVKVAERLWKWSQTEEGQTWMRRFFGAIRKAWDEKETD